MKRAREEAAAEIVSGDRIAFQVMTQILTRPVSVDRQPNPGGDT